MKVHNLSINTKTKKYSIFIGSNLISNINRIFTSQKLSFSKILIVVDKNIPIKFRKKLISNLKTDLKKIHVFHPSEKNKSQKTVEIIQNILFKNRFNRDDCLIAFGRRYHREMLLHILQAHIKEVLNLLTYPQLCWLK